MRLFPTLMRVKQRLLKKVLLYGNAIQTAGSVKGKGSAAHAKSDWMEMEKTTWDFDYHFCDAISL